MLNAVSIIFERNANNHRTALCEQHKAISYQDLIMLTRKMATWLVNHNVDSQDRVIVLGADRIENIVAILAVCYMGAVFSMINVRLPKKEIDRAVASLDSKMILDDSTLDRAIQECVHLEPMGPACTTSLSHCAVIWTSGTTNVSKGTLHTQQSFFYNAMVASQNWQICGQDKVYYTSKHCSGWAMSLLLSSLWAGSEIYIDAEPATHFRIKNNIERFKPTKFFSIPSIYADLCTKSDFSYLSSVSRFVVAGERLNSRLIERWESRTGKKLHNQYGTTELLSGPLSNLAGTSALGKTVPGWQLRIVDEHDQIVDPGQIGLLQVRSWMGNLVAGFWPQQTADTDASDWFDTNDLVKADSDGTYHFYGRKDDLVKISGEVVNLSVLDQLLMDHKDIDRACCVIKANDQGVNQIEAFVTLWNLQADHEELMKELEIQLQTNLKKTQMPKHIHIVAELCRKQSGKISRYQSLPVADQII